MGPITVTTVTEQHRWEDEMMMSPMSMGKSRDRDEMTMDVDLEDGDLKDGRASSPGSVRTYGERKV